MKKIIIAGLRYKFAISLPNPSFAEHEEIKDLRGNIVCLQVDEEGIISALEEFNVCKGLLVLVGEDGKVYSIHGSVEQIQKIAKSAEKKKVSGIVEGNQRAWRLYASLPEPKGSQKSMERTITGTIVCLLPDYERGNVKPVVSSGSCNESEPHAHVVYTNEGQIYALHGSEEAVSNIQKNSKRRNVSLKGKVQGNQNAWILFIE